MYLKRSATVKYFIAAYFGAVLYCEWFVYIIQPLYWPEFKCQPDDTSCVKILLIADPQIQGYNDAPVPLNHWFMWDSDRYLRTTFSVAFNYFRPDVLVFLGDLTDEGSIATKSQLDKYMNRVFNKIFHIYKKSEYDYDILKVWVPGDNDIGGENEPIKPDKIAAFEEAFDQPSVIMYKNITFYKVNAITHNIPPYLDESQSINYKMVVSHYPITSKYGFAQKVNNAIHPHIYFCAHDHESKYVVQNRDLTNRGKIEWFKTPGEVLNIPNDNQSLYEIHVPTCSYRMGTSSIGIGAAILEHDRSNLRYTVFWSPMRFPYLIIYLVLLLVALLYCLVFFAARLCHRTSKVVLKGEDKVPLLERI